MNGPCTLRRSQPSSLHWARQLRPGTPTSPEEYRLWLLPSGPDQVRGSSPRGTQPSAPRGPRSPTGSDLGRGFSPARADCGYRAPLAPRLARSIASITEPLAPRQRLAERTAPAARSGRIVRASPSQRPDMLQRPVFPTAKLAAPMRRLSCSWLAGQNSTIFHTGDQNECEHGGDLTARMFRGILRYRIRTYSVRTRA